MRSTIWRPSPAPGSGPSAFFYELRFAPAAIAARSLVQGSAIGRINAVRIRTLIDKATDYWRPGLTGRSASPRRGHVALAGGGVVPMNASQWLDLLSSVTQREVSSVMGIMGTFGAAIEVEDAAAAASDSPTARSAA